MFVISTNTPRIGHTPQSWIVMFWPGLAWLSTAPAFEICRPGQSRQWQLALAQLWPEPRPAGVKFSTNQIYWVLRGAQSYSVNWVRMSGNVQILLYTDHLYAYCGLVMVWKPFKRYRNTLTMLNDCQQTKTNINRWDIPRLYVIRLFSHSFVCMHLAYVNLKLASLHLVSTWCSQFSAT